MGTSIGPTPENVERVVLPSPGVALSPVGSASARRVRTGYLLLTPLVLLMVVLSLFPALYAYYMSVNHVLLSNIDQRRFVGLNNYASLLTDPAFLQSLVFSVIFALVTTTVEFVLGLGLALLFNVIHRGRGIAISLLLLPMMVAPALFGIMYRLMLNDFIGVLTYYLGLFNISTDTLVGTNLIVPVVMAIDILQWTPFVFIILFTALQAVPSEIIEAARADGAGPWKLLRHILFPFIVPAVVVALLIRGVDAFKAFDMIYVFTGGGPGQLTTTASIYIYKIAFDSSDVGRANAASVILLLLLTPVLVVTMKYILRSETPTT